MKSPYTGKDMKLKKENRTVSFRKQEIEYTNLNYYCEDSKESFVTTELDELNLKIIQNKYREINNVPFPEEIIKLRKKYGLSAAKMGELFGFGPNQYALYESGEIPSLSNSKSISLALNPTIFKTMIIDSQELLKDKDYKAILSKINNEILDGFDSSVQNYLLGDHDPDSFTGYKTPDYDKLANMVVYFAQHLKPQKTVLNKLLFYSDFGYYKNHASSITGCRYAAIARGPVPDKFRSLFEKMENDSYIDIKYVEYPNGMVGEKFSPNENCTFKSYLFNATEMNMMEKVKDCFKGKTTKDVVEVSHEESAWLDNQENKSLIDYNYAFDLKMF
ncbi:type II toxin-antitoxin system antitoxin SocA domain-containing protein [Halpernia sp.]|uniref:type II toxin-antitoxin system antitoxin SocA domain-containing protein n=1 Tax=Halpernia sp. TaxID=2782209 RepID=UPI003A9549D6